MFPLLLLLFLLFFRTMVSRIIGVGVITATSAAIATGSLTLSAISTAVAVGLALLLINVIVKYEVLLAQPILLVTTACLTALLPVIAILIMPYISRRVRTPVLLAVQRVGCETK